MSGGFTPSLRRTSQNVHGEVEFLASEDYMVKRGGVTIDSATVPADENGDKVLVKGTLVNPIGGASAKYAAYGAAGSEVQSVEVTAAPSGDDFTLTFGGETTGAIAAGASAADVQAALVALPNVADGDVAVSGADGGPWTVSFSGQYAGADVPAMTSDDAGVTVTATTEGGAALGALDKDLSGYLVESINCKDGDVICGIFLRGSVLAARVTPEPDETIRAALAGRFIFQ